MPRVRERERHIPHTHQPTTAKRILNPPDTLPFLPLVKFLPPLPQRTRQTARGRDVRAGEGGEHGFVDEEEGCY